MARNVIHIFGPSGSGTTSLGRMLCREPGFFLMDTDDYFWLPTNPPFTAKRPIPERLMLMERDIALHENVVISGSLTDWGDPLIPFFTLAVRLEMDPALRLERITQRERQRFGSRIDPGGDMYETHRAFLAWAAQYDTAGPEQRSRVKHDQWQTLLPCQLLRLDGAAPLEENFQRILPLLK